MNLIIATNVVGSTPGVEHRLEWNPVISADPIYESASIAWNTKRVLLTTVGNVEPTRLPKKRWPIFVSTSNSRIENGLVRTSPIRANRKRGMI